MKYIKQFLIIVTISFVGEVLHSLLPIPCPASIYGIIILFLLLEFGIIKLEQINDAGKFLIDIMPMLFIPAAVGLMNSWGLMKESLFEFSVITFVSTFLVMGISGVVTQFVIRINGRRKKNGK